MKNNKIDAVIFDLDGVIFDSEILHQAAWERVFAMHNIAIDKQDYLKGIGISDKDFLREILKDKKIHKDISRLINEKRKILLEISDQAKSIDGVACLIKDLHNDYKLAVASNSDKDFVLKLLKNFGLTEFFSVILGFQDISKPKPDPEIYLKCAEGLDVSASRCVVIEDSPAGIRAAKNAGMKCIAVATTIDKDSLFEADFVLRDLEISEIKKILSLFP